MNSSTKLSSDRQKDPNTVSLSPRKWIQLKKSLETNLVPVLAIAATLSTAMVAISASNTWNIYRNFKTAINKNFRLQELSGKIVHLDEVLTMSARMAASTGDLKWEKRYNDNVDDLDTAISEVSSLAPDQKENSEQTDAANLKLVEMEENSFKLLREGKKDQAFKILFSEEYGKQKKIYSDGIEGTLNNIKESVDAQIQSYSQQLRQSMLFAGISLPILGVSWVVVLSLVRSYTRERNAAQAALVQANEQLEKRVEERTEKLVQQELATRKDSEVLQEDVGLILDVVSAIEEGNLTVRAPVSDRVTGLVSDTLNRLTEELSKVLAQVLYATGQVNQVAKQLESTENTIAANSQQQAESVAQVLDLTNKVEQSALDSAKQIQTSISSLQTLRTAVEKGQGGITELNKGISTLQQGTEQIIQQIKTLGEFVGLTDQFVQEQSQISSMTQVLAMNASLVAARASEQRDPTQFVVVAREFESIANQVSTLAQRTSGGLVSLEQRSNQIHNVVTSIDANVQNLGGLVKEFTQGVEQSNQVFEEVHKTADEAVQAGEVVASSSEGIVSSAQSTAQLMRYIASLAEKTAQLTQNAKLQSENMEKLSRQLLSSVQFFRLSDMQPKRIDSSQSQDRNLQIESTSVS
jgi:twitching motility protein PilJ